MQSRWWKSKICGNNVTIKTGSSIFKQCTSNIHFTNSTSMYFHLSFKIDETEKLGNLVMGCSCGIDYRSKFRYLVKFLVKVGTWHLQENYL